MRQNNTEKKDDRQKDPQDMSMEFNMMQVKNDEVEQKDSKMDLQELSVVTATPEASHQFLQQHRCLRRAAPCEQILF